MKENELPTFITIEDDGTVVCREEIVGKVTEEDGRYYFAVNNSTEALLASINGRRAFTTKSAAIRALVGDLVDESLDEMQMAEDQARLKALYSLSSMQRLALDLVAHGGTIAETPKGWSATNRICDTWTVRRPTIDVLIAHGYASVERINFRSYLIATPKGKSLFADAVEASERETPEEAAGA